MNNQHRGFLYGVLAAICYGTNPLGALHLYAAGFNPGSVLFYRFLGAAVLSGLFVLILHKDPRIPREDFPYIGALGVLFAISALALFSSFLFMDAGIASTLLFAYPILVALFMVFFFHEKLHKKTILSILLAVLGVGLLMRTNEGGTLSLTGIALVFFSSITYAAYIIIAAHMPKSVGALKMNMVVFGISAVCLFAFNELSPSHSIHPIETLPQLGWALQLAFVPSLLSLVFMQKALRTIGSTPTAILGALEPLTAVAIGVGVFGEALTLRLGIGILLILGAVILLAIKKH
ncbi:MAG: DMT family transporter [Fibrobacter sp.]|nr:DMT family transporter [Fibrobacter sp.]